MPYLRAAFTFTLFLLMTSCKRAPEPGQSSTAPAAAQSTVSTPAPVPAPHATEPAKPGGGIVWKDPAENFERLENSGPMRKASYRVKKVAGDPEDTELAVFHFGAGQGGSLDANVERWIGQFSGVKPDGIRRSDRSANGLNQHVVEIEEGTYKSGMPGGGAAVPKQGFALIGAIVTAPNGNWFFKMTGPKKTVKARRAALLEMLDSVKAE